MEKFRAVLKIIGINPYVSLPPQVLVRICKAAGKEKSPIRVKGHINDQPFQQNLVRYLGEWHLYINTTILPHSPKRIGESIRVELSFDPEPAPVPEHHGFNAALSKHPLASKVFRQLPASRRKEIVRYIAALKSEKSIEANIIRAINFLEGRGRFVGRDKP
ncbi:MAG: YdeI/OmpD-associated family protein [Bacteroidota bacterium]|nr:YdeI/OmpD-associated family protein [Bacteroidota bacterium]